MRLVIALGLWVLVLVLRTEALSYYVATNGCDTNSGTIGAPFRTLQHAASKLSPGDTCYIRGGIYRETLTAMRSGTRIAPITFIAFGDEIVTISALEVVTGWQASGGGVYSAHVNGDLGNGYNQVFADGSMLQQARLPNFGKGDEFHPAIASVTVGGKQNTVITSSTWGGHPANYWAGAWFCGGIGVRWSWQCARVVASRGNQITVDPATKSNPWFTGHGVGFVWGLEKLLDEDMEWHLTSQTPQSQLSVRLTGGADPMAHDVEMKRRNWCVNFNDQSYVTVRRLQLCGGAVHLSGRANSMEDCDVQYPSHFMTYAWGYAYDGGREAGSGVLVDGSHNAVYGCTIHDTAGSGLIVTGSNNLLSRNLVFNTDYSGTYGCGLRLAGSCNQVSYNTVHTSGRDILQPGGNAQSIWFNDCYGPGQMCLDAGVVYIWGVNAQDSAGTCTRLAFNWFHDNLGIGPRPIIYLDSWCRNFVIDHNVCWNSIKDSGLRINRPAAGHLIYNNTLFNCDDIGTHTYDMWPAKNPDTVFWKSNRYEYIAAANLFLGSLPQAQLQDWARRNFNLWLNASTIDKSVRVAGHTVLIPLSGPPKKGAYEPGSAGWKPGVNGWCQPRLAITNLAPGVMELSGPGGVAGPTTAR